MATSVPALASEIVHDAEYYILKARHGETWAKQDSEIQTKLAALEKKHGRKPNIVHIMWDDTAVGEIGVPQNQAARGFKTPNMNNLMIAAWKTGAPVTNPNS